MSIGMVSFVILGVLATIVSGFMITRRFPVNAAVLMIVDFVLLAGMYGLMGAHFSATSQIVVYAGAIMVVFVFVIMLLNLPPEDLPYGRITLGEWVLILVATGAAVALGTAVGQGTIAQGMSLMGVAPFTSDGLLPLAPAGQAPYYPIEENVRNVSAALFTDYVWAFELVGILLMIGLIGAVVIAKKRSEDAQSA
jgi:NADH-quinone oxidoreductase subunit J